MAKAKPVELQNVSEPNLYRDMFPYTELPKVHFEDAVVPPAPPHEIWVTDTTFRDGQQARPPYTIQQIVEIFKLLTKLDNGSGIVRMSEFFVYSKKDREAVEKCQELGAKFPEVTSWIRAVKSDFKLVKDMNVPETGILTSCSDYHIYLKLHKDRRQALEQYLDVVRSALEHNIRPRCHFEDITRADFYGFVIPFAQELMKLRDESGLDIKIRLCDTMGYGVPWVHATLPRSIPKMVHAMVHLAGVPSELLEFHGHNDFHKVLINPATAWLYGCAGCNSSLLGIGERTGNSPLEAMVIEAAQLREAVNSGQTPDYQVITEIAKYFREVIGYQIPPNFPLVGRDFNTTRAGIHADGLLKSEEIYSAFDTRKILGRPAAVAITDKSGAAGIKHWIERHYNQDVAKDDPRLLAIRDKVEAEYETGRTTAVSDEEMHTWYAEAFDITNWGVPKDGKTS
ncbi:MAG: 2-isopropylmalate synthase [Phycisphaerae bacterium]|nr:2-isopropylmalate synthase [Phycisphaerae bacterium]